MKCIYKITPGKHSLITVGVLMEDVEMGKMEDVEMEDVLLWEVFEPVFVWEKIKCASVASCYTVGLQNVLLCKPTHVRPQ